MISTYLEANLTILEARKGYHESMLAVYREMSNENVIEFIKGIDEDVAIFFIKSNSNNSVNLSQTLCDAAKNTISAYDILLETLQEVKSHPDNQADYLIKALLNLQHSTRKAKKHEERVKQQFSAIAKKFCTNIRTDKMPIFKDFILESQHAVELIQNYEAALRLLDPQLVELCEQSFNSDDLYHKSGLDPDKTILLFPVQCQKITRIAKTFKEYLNKKLPDDLADRARACLINVQEAQQLASKKRDSHYSGLVQDYYKIQRILEEAENLLKTIKQEVKQKEYSYIDSLIPTTGSNKGKAKLKAKKNPSQQSSTRQTHVKAEPKSAVTADHELPDALKKVCLASEQCQEPKACEPITSTERPDSVRGEEPCIEPYTYQYTPYQKTETSKHDNKPAELSPALQSKVEQYRNMIEDLASGRLHKQYTFNELMELINALGAKCENKSGSIRRLSLPAAFCQFKAHMDVLEVANETIHAPHNGNKAKERVGSGFAKHFASLLNKAGFTPDKLWPSKHLRLKQ